MAIKFEPDIKRDGYDDMTIHRLLNTDTKCIADIALEGLRLLDWTALDKKGVPTKVVWSYPTSAQARADRSYQNFLAIGQTNNRHGNGVYIDPDTHEKVQLDKNDGPIDKETGEQKHTLHGGKDGWHKKTHTYEGKQEVANGVKLRFSMEKKDGEQGYPGNVVLLTDITMLEDGSLIVEYEATTDATTPIYVTPHQYRNHNGTDNPRKTIKDLYMQTNAIKVVAVNNIDELIPTGKFIDVKNTIFDFRNGRKIGIPEFFKSRGYDNNFVAPEGENIWFKVWSEITGIQEEITSNMPAGQFYTAFFNKLGVTPSGKYTAVVIEPGPIIDSPNHPEWGHHYTNSFARKEQPYRGWIKMRLTNLKQH